jgi:DNA-binding response OmpR family regulator
LCYTRVRSELNLRFMRQFALRPSVSSMQTLADMAEKKTTAGSHRVLVALEGAADAASLASRLEHEGFEVMTAIDEQEAVQIASTSWQPDVVLLDLTLPELDALSVCKQIRATNQRAVIFVLSGDSQEDEVRSLEAGADDYLAKFFSPEVLLARIRAHLRTRRTAGNQRILEIGDLWLDTKNYATWVKGEWVELRPQEFRLLVALARSLGVPVSRQELVRRSGASWRGAYSRTVDIHISRIRARIETPSDYTYIHSIRGVGYRFEPVPKGTSVSSRTPPKDRAV